MIRNACTIILTESSSFIKEGTYDLWNSSNSGTRPNPVVTYKELKGDDLEAFKSKLAAAGGEYNEDYDAMIAPFPMAPFPLINAPTSTDDLSYYRIIPSATTKGVDIWLRFSWFIQRKGVFEITYQLKGADDTGVVQRVKK